MAKIVAPDLRSIRTRRQRAPRANPVKYRDTRIAVHVGDRHIVLGETFSALQIALNDIFESLLISLEVLDEGKFSALNVGNTSQLALAYLDLWSDMVEDDSGVKWSSGDVGRARTIIEGADRDGIDIDVLRHDLLQTQGLRMACAECLIWNAGVMRGRTARTLVYMEAVRRALPWHSDVDEHMTNQIRWLWKNAQGVVADQTGFHCAYQFGIDVVDQRREKLVAKFGPKGAAMVTAFNDQMYQLIAGGESRRLMTELNADCHEYLKRSATQEEEVLCSLSYEGSKQEGVQFVNAAIQGDTQVLDKIKPF